MSIKSLKVIVGLDEVGRGSLVGPVVACALSFQSERKNKLSNLKIKDSKRLSHQKREEIFHILKENPSVEWGIGRVSEKVIDKINIFEATKLAMERAVKNLEKKIAEPIGSLLIDGNFGINLPLPQKSVIKGDERVFLIKLASIVAKVKRDGMMINYHKEYPEYHFDKHKGYGTKLHLEMLKKFGPSKIHRKTFEPVRRYCKI